jgi:hypothetical protein
LKKHALISGSVTRGRLDSIGGTPYWYHRHGQTMVHVPDQPNVAVCIQNKVATVTISAETGIAERWNVSWSILSGREESSGGNRLFSEEQMKCAFGLMNTFSYGQSNWQSNVMLNEFGGTVACPGRFIRWQNYLNIPEPGTGHDGTIAVSIYLDDTIREAVRKAISYE